jgi:hypothetical protein
VGSLFSKFKLFSKSVGEVDSGEMVDSAKVESLTVGELAESFRDPEHHLGAVLVVDDQNKPVSILTREDISRVVEQYSKQQYAMIGLGPPDFGGTGDDGGEGGVDWSGNWDGAEGGIKMIDRSEFAEVGLYTCNEVDP